MRFSFPESLPRAFAPRPAVQQKPKEALRALVKWVGGKRRLAPQILARMPHFKGRYWEPMCGSAAVFAALYNEGRLPAGVVLSDINSNLVALLKSIRDAPSLLLEHLRVYDGLYREGTPQSREALYYVERDLWNEGKTEPARFILLKTIAFNGLWRVSKSGRHNVGWGKYATARLYDEANVMAWNVALQKVDIRSGTVFSTIGPKPGDLVYVDPPYVGTFSGYHQDGFKAEDQEHLLQVIAAWVQEGVHVAYSNSLAAETAVARLWPTGVRHRLMTSYTVNRDGDGRKPVEELLVVE